MSAARRVWVVVLQWNGWAMTRDCLDSLARITYPAARVVLVDNGSTDGSLEEARRATGVELMEAGRNLRFAEGNNLALRQALAGDAEYALLLNNDTLVEPGFLEPLVDFLEAHPRAGAAAPLILFAEPGERIWFAGGGVNFWLGLTWHRGLRQVDRGQFREPQRCGYLTGCCLLIRREVLDKVGLLDPSYFIYTEDADYSERMRRSGYELWFVPASRIRHRVSASSGGGSSPFKMYHRVRSNLQFFRRYARPWHWLTWPLAFAAVALGFALVAALDGRRELAVATWRGLWDGIRNAEVPA